MMDEILRRRLHTVFFVPLSLFLSLSLPSICRQRQHTAGNPKVALWCACATPSRPGGVRCFSRFDSPRPARPHLQRTVAVDE
ncbi:hypothetical protein B0T19DRAFT_410990 [Cercophora scortea]|uniref:Secreted protein n=1 Tax=Cercophora scortea TaxID=314031 RepID=A0AAE0J4X7_9PEZI|nr:hypothetical protein B0T19DRAFT_410990 [Cercophora scortea]